MTWQTRRSFRTMMLFSATTWSAGQCTQWPSLCCDAHSSRGETRRYQSAARDICCAEIRLVGVAALGHQRKPSAARKRDSFSRINGVGAISLAADKHLSGVAPAVGDDHLAAGGAISAAQ